MPTSEKISLPYARLSFPKLSKARKYDDDGEARYEASFLLDPTHKGHAKVIAQIKEVADRVAKEHWGGKVPKGLKPCFGDDGNGKEYDGYDGMFVLSSAKNESDGRVLVVDRDGNPVEVGDEQYPYAGCFVEGTISLWTNDHPKGGKRINANLRGVRFLKDGEAFSSVTPINADEEFEDLGDDFSDFEGDDDPLSDDDDPLA